MLPYLVFVLIILLFQYTPKIKYREIISFFILLFFSAFRGNGDGDYFRYLHLTTFMKKISDIFDSTFPAEIGFRVLSYINNQFGFDPQVVIATMNIISLTATFYIINRYSRDKMLSIFLFLPLFFQYDMHAARTAVAIGISMLAFNYLYNERLFKFCIVVFLASLFHKTSLVLLILVVFKFIKFNRLSMLWITGITVVGSLFISLNKMIYIILSIIPDKSIADRFLTYINSSEYGYPFKLYDPRLLLVFLIFILCIYTLGATQKEIYYKHIIWTNLLLIIILREHTVFVTRLTAYFNIYTILIIPEVIFNKKNFNQKISLYFGKIKFIKSKFIKLIENLLTSESFIKNSFILIYCAYISRYIIINVPYRLFFWN